MFGLFNRTPKCKHIYKTTHIEYLKSYSRMSNYNSHIEIDYYDTYLHQEECVLCDKQKSTTTNELVVEPKQKCSYNY